MLSIKHKIIIDSTIIILLIVAVMYATSLSDFIAVILFAMMADISFANGIYSICGRTYALCKKMLEG